MTQVLVDGDGMSDNAKSTEPDSDGDSDRILRFDSDNDGILM